MVKFYVMKIKDGVIMVKDVPDLWRTKVRSTERRVGERACKKSL